MKLLIVSLVVIGIGVLLMAIKVIFKRGGEFPSGHVSDVPALKAKGIECHRAQMRDANDHRMLEDRVKESI